LGSSGCAAGNVKSRDHLIDACLRPTSTWTTRTIDSHIKRIRKKFRTPATHDFEHIETLYGIGYRSRSN